MRIDLYTKVVLTVIAVALTTIACNPLIHPSGVAADGPLAGVQTSFAAGLGIFVFDTKTGQMWNYGNGIRKPEYFGKITKVGEPLDKTPPRN